MAAKKTKPEEAEEVLQPDPVHAQTASEGFFARLLAQFTTAWRFFTRIPLPAWWNRPQVDEAVERPEIVAQTDIAEGDVASDLQSDTEQSDMGQNDRGQRDKGATLIPLADTVRAWPVVGLFIGALAGFALWLAAGAGLSPLAASFTALIVAALATGALHEDGLADVADGFGGGADKTKKLRIMRDSHIGAYGVLALVLAVGFKAGSLSGFNSPVLAASALIAAHTLSRAMLPMLMVVLPPASRSGLGKAAGQPHRENAAMAAAIGVLVAVLALGFGPGLVAAVLAALGVAAVGWLAHRQIDGFTGDVLGAAQQVAEALVLAGLAVVLRTVFYA